LKTKPVWDDCVKFHGHECGGLAIGYQVCEYAAELLDITYADCDSLFCVAELSSCPVDAVRLMFGCTEENKNLIIKPNDRRAFHFYNPATGEKIQLTPKEYPEMPREKMKEWLMQTNYRQLFDRAESDCDFSSEFDI